MTIQYDYSGKVAFVTGAGTGIGRATALAFAKAGASVAAAGLPDANTRETVRLIENAGGRAMPIPCDVAREDEVEAAIARTIDAFGQLDFAFNNAGVEQPITAAADISVEEWDRQIAINLRGCSSA